MRTVLYGLILASLAQGCNSTSKERVLRPAKVEEFALPPASESRLREDPAYPEEKRTFQPKPTTLPASMRDAGGGPGGMGGGGMSMPMQNGPGGIR
jgi:hypothetical protein